LQLVVVASQVRSHVPAPHVCPIEIAADPVALQLPTPQCWVQLAPLQERAHDPSLQVRSQVEPAAHVAVQESVAEHVNWHRCPGKQLHSCVGVHVSVWLVAPSGAGLPPPASTGGPPLASCAPETVHVAPPCGVQVPENDEPETVTLHVPGTPAAVVPE
jgi:hypothetical protein